ncbi:MAG: lysylphosphatidylglycerol synthase domain-containing protein, partial [Chloroflexota bacterium]
VQVPLSLPAAAAATAMTIALQTFQVTPGGIGLYETSMSAALVTFGVEPHTAISAAVLTHAIKFVYAYATGLPCLLFCGAGRLRLRALWP